MLEEILNTANQVATVQGMPLVFGDTFVQNEAANGIEGMFYTLDIPRTTFVNPVFMSVPSYSITVRCMGTSHYMRNDAMEIQTLIDTEFFILRMLETFICKYQLGNVDIVKVQNEYDSIKSGWEATFTIESTQ